MKEENPYLIRMLEESSGYYAGSFSNRYLNWKRVYSITKSIEAELNRRKWQSSIKILDVGCGNGQLIYLLMARFLEKYALFFTGIDISELDIEFANNRKEYFGHKDCEFRVMDAENMDFNNEEFDIIICSEMIEHIADVSPVLNALYRILKENGSIILTTPNKDGGLLVRFLRALEIRRREDAGDIKRQFISSCEEKKARLSSNMGSYGSGNGHLSVKTKKQWEIALQKAGFRKIYVQGTGGLIFGDPYVDNHRLFFVFTVVMDIILEKLPGSFLWSELLLFKIKK
ncbi:MAG: class I SAM-dependent methyltransferase [Candidatus Omnitrophica bacterium]|nr:class I SAM-dependent methyltransferase [Candidatus Omnitrophota bacterium]